MASDNYISKVLTLLVRRANGQIRIPAAELMEEDIGQGIMVHFDYNTKELVLSFVPKGATIHVIKGGETWLTTSIPGPPSPEPSRLPLTKEELVARVWTDSAGTATNQELHRPPKREQIVLDDNRQAAIEAARQAAARLKEIDEFRSPQPPTRSRQVTEFSKR